MPKKYVLTVTLNPAIDKTIQVKNFSVGRDFRAEDITLSAGGKGLNVSRALRDLKAPSLATGLLGGASGDFIRRELKKEGIPNDFSWVAGETRTNLTVIDHRRNKITRVLEKGPYVTRLEFSGFKRKFASLLKNSRYVIFSGSIPRGLPESLFAQLINTAKKKNIRALVDTSGEPLKAALRARPFLIKPNLEEAETVLGRKLNSLLRIKEALKYFLKSGVKIIVISMGKDGAVASNEKETWQAVAPKLKCKNNVGCGDALLAGFVYAHEHNNNFRDSFQFAVACGAANVLSLKPGAIQEKAVQKLFPKISVRPL